MSDNTVTTVLCSAGNYSIEVNVGTYSEDHHVDAAEVAQQLREVADMVESTPEWLEACRVDEDGTR